MMSLAEYRRTASRLADYLPWAALVGPGIVLNKDGSFQRSAKFRGPDLDSAVAAELVAVAGRINNAFRRLGSGWSIFVEAQRSEAATYPDSTFPDPASALLDAERKAAFEEAGAHFVSSYFLTFLYLPPAEETARAETWLYEGREQSGVDPHEVLRAFIDRTDRVLALLDGFMPECAWLDDSETLTYLHSTISTNRHRVRVPETPIYLDALLADQPLTGGLEPRLGGQHLRMLTIIGFPTATTPGLLDDLNRLAFPYRWSTRAILLDKTDATRLLTRIRRQWFAKRKSVAAILKEVMTNEASALVDTDAANKVLDADMALQELGADVAGMAYVTATITVWDADPRLADEKLRLAEKVIQGRDFTAMVETVNAVDAWLGSLPGNAYANVRQPPISTLNLAHMIPLSAVWAGPERDEHFGAPPLLFGKTEGSTPFRLSLHVGDVGHTLVVGPTGAGKSVLLALMALQFRRYAGSQVFAFDFGGSIRAASLAMGGDWHDLGGGLTEGSDASVSLQPLARIHDTYERAWAADWIVAILMREGIAITPEAKEHIWTALTSLASAPVEERTITGLSVLLQSNDLKQALRPFCIGGAYGRMLDAEAEHLGSADVQAFEIEGLVGTGAAPAVLAYLFHRIGDRLDGRPTLLIIDEGWLALDDEGFASQLREWLKTLRKKNASVIFATHSLSDIDGSGIAPAIIESCPTRLLLPNERAIEPQITAIYRRFGLNDRQIEILARATPKRDYYCQSRMGHRLFELGLSEVGLALCAASAKSDQTLIAQIVAEHEAGASATNDRRPEFQRMIEAATSKPAPFDIVVVHSFSRFFRDHFELEFNVRKLAKNGVKLVSITQEMGDDPMHQMMRQIMALFDEYQSKENAKHVLRAMNENARQGFWNGALPPIGYRIVAAEQRGSKVKKKLEIDPLHAETVRLIYRLFLEGDGTSGAMGVKSIATYLNERRIFTRDGGRWGLAQIHAILTRTTYIGEHRFNTRSHKDREKKPESEVAIMAVPPLIEREIYDAVQARLKSRNPMVTPARVSSGPTLLTGICFCAKCGGAMTLRTGRGSAGATYRYYTCSTKARQGKTGCKGRTIPMDKLDHLVAGHIEDRLLQPKRLETVLASVIDRRQERDERRREHLAELHRRITETDQRLGRLFDAIESGMVDKDDPMAKERMTGLKALRDQAAADAERTQLALDSSGNQAVSPDMLKGFARKARERIRLDDGGYRRDHLRALAQRVEVADNEVRIMGSKSELLRTLVAASSVETAAFGVHSSVLKWRTRQDSNL